MSRNTRNAPLHAAIAARLGVSAATEPALRSLSLFPRPVTSVQEAGKLEGFHAGVLEVCRAHFSEQGAAAAALPLAHAASLIIDVDSEEECVLVEEVSSGGQAGRPHHSATTLPATAPPAIASVDDILTSLPLRQRLGAAAARGGSNPAPALAALSKAPAGAAAGAAARSSRPLSQNLPSSDAENTGSASAAASAVVSRGRNSKRSRSESPPSRDAALLSSAEPAAGGGGAGGKLPPPAADSLPPEETAWTCPCCERGHLLAPCTRRWYADPLHPGRLPRPAQCPSGPAPHTCALDAPNWEVVLLLDNREVRSREDRGFIESQLQSKGVAVEVRALALGDVMWVVRRRAGTPAPALLPPSRAEVVAAALGDGPPGGAAGVIEAALGIPHGAKANKAAASAAVAAAAAVSVPAGDGALGKKKRGGKAAGEAAPPWSPDAPARAREWVLDAIVERKCVSDLAASLTDGRYMEQKLRLKESGLRVTYLVEGDPHKLADNSGFGARIGSKHILSAMIATQVHDGFRVVSTYTLDATVSLLAKMHHALVAQFRAAAGCGGPPAPAAAFSSAAPPARAGSLHAAPSSQSARAAPPPSSQGGPSSSQALYLSQVASDMAHVMGDPLCLIGPGLGARGGPQAGSSSLGPLSGTMATASVVAPVPSHVCPFDRCALLGRPGLPTQGMRCYADFHVAASRPRTYSALHLFGMMLRQVGGCSADRAQAVLQRFSTPAALAATYDALPAPARDGPGLLKGLPVPRQRNAFGPALSASIFEVYNAGRHCSSSSSSAARPGGGGAPSAGGQALSQRSASSASAAPAAAGAVAGSAPAPAQKRNPYKNPWKRGGGHGAGGAAARSAVNRAAADQWDSLDAAAEDW